MSNHIYFDHAATTPLHPEVAKYIYSIMLEGPGNASSMHAFGRSAKQKLNAARDMLAQHLNAHPSEFVFTSGGTESDNTALFGAARAMRQRGKDHIITSAVEHHAVLHACEVLAKEGFRVTVVPVDELGRVSPADVEEAITAQTALISVMWGNNEVGTLQPIREIGELAKASGILFHVDAVQALGLMPINLAGLPVDFMSFSSHKINGPQGVGALYVAKGTPYEPLLYGGNQERKRRAGTENVAGIAGFAKAVEIAAGEWEAKRNKMDELRLRWETKLKELLGEQHIRINGDPVHKLAHISNISFIGTDTETMLMNLDMEGIAAASGSACTSGSLEKSHVLQAMGLAEERLNSAVRFSFGLGNTVEDIELAAQKTATIAARIRK
jgi:cysteine desulfurase